MATKEFLKTKKTKKKKKISIQVNTGGNLGEKWNMGQRLAFLSIFDGAN